MLIIPVMASEAAENYVKEVQALLKQHEFHADVDLGGNTLNKKVRNGQLLQYNFIFGKSTLQFWRFLLTGCSSWCQGD